ncbi:hypothetical protein [Sulfitobacter sp. R18_1]|uniref:hypothetical protein n=1 Tax=Sulfitobacter sp. R18_1 TaxID=2821104 RepID=UPI001ADB26FF|nr:hypothetical protein [Sulfitobacter sp. R18_1]MBO9428145.1 hypothetical protein [Sulfitobacter sp. R18_1]
MKLLNPLRYTESSAALFAVDEENILVGPGRDPSEAITDLEGSNFHSVCSDTLLDADTPFAELGCMETSKRVREVLELVQLEDAIIEMDTGILIAPIESKKGMGLGVAAVKLHPEGRNELVGLFSGPSLAVHSHHQSQGIGTALTAAQLIHGGGLMTWEHDEPGYSMDGAKTMLRGFNAAITLLDIVHTPNPGM